MAKPTGIIEEIGIGHEGEEGQGRGRGLGSGNQRELMAFTETDQFWSMDWP